MTQFNNLMQCEIEEVWQTGKARLMRRLDLLSQRWFSVHNHVPDKIQEVAIQDRILDEKFGPIEDDDPLIFGGIQLTAGFQTHAKKQQLCMYQLFGEMRGYTKELDNIGILRFTLLMWGHKKNAEAKKA